MGHELYNTQPLFHDIIDQCAELLNQQLERPLLSVLYPKVGEKSPLDDTAYTQPALFALEYALARLWQSWGITPAAIMGHSVGEYVAACVAGVFSLEDGLRLIAVRGQLMSNLPRNGAMVAVDADEGRVRATISPYSQQVSIAALNGPGNIVISGLLSSLLEIIQELEKEGIQTHRLKVSHAFHSPLMEPMLDSFTNTAASVRYTSPSIRLVSNVSGEVVKSTELENANYWRSHICQPVRFAQSIQAIQQLGCTIMLEVGPKPTLIGMAQHILPGDEFSWLSSLSARRSDWDQILESMAKLYIQGVNVDWERFDQGLPRKRVSLPTYPFQRQRYWFQSSASAGRSDKVGLDGQSVHPLLGRRIISAAKEVQYECLVGPRTPSYLADRLVHGMHFLPESVYVELGLAAGRDYLKLSIVELDDLVVHQRIELQAETLQNLQVILTPEGPDRLAAKIFTLTPGEEKAESGWELLAICHLKGKGSQLPPPHCDFEEMRARFQPYELDAWQDELKQAGFEYGPRFLCFDQIWQGEGQILAKIGPPEDRNDYSIHPVLLDAAAQLLSDGIPKETFLITEVQCVMMFETGAPAWCLARRDSYDEQFVTGMLAFYGDQGQLLIEINGLRLESANPAALKSPPIDFSKWLYEVAWQPQPRPIEPTRKAEQPGIWLILADQGGVGLALAARMEQQGERCLIVSPQSIPAQGAKTLDAFDPQAYLALFNGVEAEGKALLRGVVHMWSLDAPNNAHLSASALEDTQRLTIGSALFLVQALAAFYDECKNEYYTDPPRLWIVTCGAQPVIKGQEIEIAQGAIWGFGKTVALELPHLWGGMIDLNSDNPAEDVDALVAEVKWPEGEDQIAYCRGTRYVARLSSYREKFVLRTQTSFRSDSAYLISGGLGGLGLEVACWMAVEGARRIILLGRTPLPPRSIWDQLPAGSLESSQVAAIRAIEALGTTVYQAAVDVSDEAQLVSFLETFAEQVGAPIRGVIHAAGIIEDQSLLLMNLEKLQTVLRPKVLGGWLLHEKLAELSLEFFVTFSSSASLWGSLGQANYAAANAFLDSLAYYRRAQGKAGLSINWGPWGEVGMSARSNLKERLARLDIASLSPRQGLMLMGKLLFQSIAQIGVVAIEPQQLHSLFPSESHFLAGLGSGDSLSIPINQPDHELTMQILQTEPEKRLALTLMHLKTRIGRVVRLNAEQIPDDRSLMELGFDSIMVMELIRSLEKDLKLILFPREIFEQPSIAAFAGYLLVELDRMNSVAATGPDLQAPANMVGESPPIEPLHEQEFFPLSYSQQRLLFAEQFDPGTPTYNIPVVLRLQGRLDHPALEMSLEKILQRHEALRTTFEFREGEWRPAIQSFPSVLMSTVDLQSISDPEVRKLEAHKLVTQEVCRPFNLGVGPMLRSVLFKLAPSEHILTLTVHHIACDGWSIGVLLNELAVLYSAAMVSEQAALPALPIQYGDYAAWQQKWLRSDLLKSQLAFWKKQLGEPIVPVIELPADHPRPAIQSYQGEQHLFSLSPTLLDQLKSLSQQEGATLFMTLLAAFYVLLRRYTGQEDLFVGVPISGRNRPELAPLIGFFVNNLVFRANLAGNPTFREFLAQVKRTALDAYAHQDIPFERLVEELHPERSLSHSPLFQVMFALQNSPMPHLDLPGLTLTHLEDIHTHTSKFDLFLSLTELLSGLTANAEYSTELFNTGTVERLMASYQALLESIVANPDLTVSELNILNSDQMRHILVDWNATEMDYPKRPMHSPAIRSSGQANPGGCGGGI